MAVAEVGDGPPGHGARTGAGGLRGDEGLVLQQPVPQVLDPAVAVERIPRQRDLLQDHQSVEEARRHRREPVVPHVELRGVRRQVREVSEV